MFEDPKKVHNDIPYRYRELESPTYIRVLELLPKNFDHERSPCCRIHHMDLDDPQLEYDAISYVWGDRSEALRKVIYAAEGGVFYVTPNLHNCLAWRQDEYTSLFLWADGICINQADDEDAIRERSAQVQLMNRLYSEAKLVWVDLGDGAKDDDRALLEDGIERTSDVDEEHWNAVMTRARADFCHRPSSAVLMAKSFHEKQAYYAAFANLLSRLDIPGPKSEFWDEFKKILDRPWFRRVWIIQELSLARVVRFRFGSLHYSGEVFRIAALRCLEYRDTVYYLTASYKSRGSRLKSKSTASIGAALVFSKLLLSGYQDHPPDTQDESDQWASEHPIWDLFETWYLAQEIVGNDEDSSRSDGEHSSGSDADKSSGSDADKSSGSDADKSSGNDGGHSVTKAPPLSLIALFSRFRRFHCSRKVDRIYGLLGLAEDRNAPELYVDYTESLQQLSTRVSRYLISQGFARQILYHGCYWTSSPSWALAIDKEAEDSRFLISCTETIFGRPPQFKAAGNTEPAFRFIPGRDHLLTECFVIGEVDTQTAAFPNLGDADVKFSDMHLMYSLMRWNIEMVRWAKMISDSENRDMRALLRECCRSMLADLRFDDYGTYQRNGNDRGWEIALHKFIAAGPLMAGRSVPFSMAIQVVLRYQKGFLRAWAPYESLLQDTLSGRRLGYVRDESKHKPGLADSRGCVCQLPGSSEVGDLIAVFPGCSVPFILRKAPDGDAYRIIGCCYVDGMMDGEALEEGRCAQRDVLLS